MTGSWYTGLPVTVIGQLSVPYTNPDPGLAAVAAAADVVVVTDVVAALAGLAGKTSPTPAAAASRPGASRRPPSALVTARILASSESSALPGSYCSRAAPPEQCRLAGYAKKTAGGSVRPDTVRELLVLPLVVGVPGEREVELA